MRYVSLEGVELDVANAVLQEAWKLKVEADRLQAHNIGVETANAVAKLFGG